MVTIRGKRVSGHKAATATLTAQLPLISREFSEIAQCHPGTINVEFEQPLIGVTPIIKQTHPLAFALMDG